VAAFPSSVKTFTTKENVVHVVDADHPNTSEAEITAIETVLGVMPQQSTARGVTYATVRARLEAIESDYRLESDHDSHALLVGLAGDDHTQYLRTDGTRAFSGLTNIAAVPGAAAIGDTPAEGTAMRLARSDHRHGVTAAAPVASAVGDTQAEGAAATFARSDHRHAREAFGAVSDGTAYGGAPSNGTAITVARSDHFHGTPGLATGGSPPVNQDYADVAAVGAATTAAKADHRHGMPALASTAPVTQALGDAAAVGIATTPARADHRHGMPALATTVTDERTYGITPAVGTSPVPARQDHTHGSPPPDVRGPVGAVVLWASNTLPVGWVLCNGQALDRTVYAALFTALGGTSSVWGLPSGTTFSVPDLRSRAPIGAGQGTGLSNRVLAATGGAETHVLSVAELASHNHGMWVDGNNFNTGGENVGHVHWVNAANPTTTFETSNHSHDVGVPAEWTQNLNHVHYGVPGRASEGGTMGAQTGFNIRSSDQIGPHQHGVNHDHGNTGGNNVGHVHNANHGHSGGVNYTGSNAAHNNMQPWVALNYIIFTGVFS
jgi:microcystin-dependent protein